MATYSERVLGESDSVENSTATGHNEGPNCRSVETSGTQQIKEVYDVKALIYERYSSVLRFPALDIPVGSTITDARLWVTATEAASQLRPSIWAVIEKDGLWDTTGTDLGWRAFGRVNNPTQNLWKYPHVLRDSGAGTISSESITASLQGQYVRRNVYDPYQTGKTINTPGTSTLGDIDLNVYRVGTRSINLVCRVYAVTTPATSPVTAASGLPVGSILATSDTFAFNSLPTAKTTASTFTFSGGNQITLTDAHYHFAIGYETLDAAPDDTNYFAINGTNLFSSNLRTYSYGRIQGFSAVNYPIDGHIPTQFNDTLGSRNSVHPQIAQENATRTAPIGADDLVDWDLTDLIVSYVAAGGYNKDDLVCLTGSMGNLTSTQSANHYRANDDDPSSDWPLLEITYDPPFALKDPVRRGVIAWAR